MDESRRTNKEETTMCQFHVKYLFAAGVSLLINIKCSAVLVLKTFAEDCIASV
jgi:hypothetical protein